MRLCFFLLLAGMLDAVLTHFGIVSGFVEEGNPLMQFVIEKGWPFFYLVKILLPLLLLGIFYYRPLNGRIKTLLVSACVLYFIILVYHSVWIILSLS